MKRISQSLFEEIQKVTSEQIDEKKNLTHDEDKDGDEDSADYMMKRRKAGGQSHAQAHAATRKHNEEVEIEGLLTQEEFDSLTEKEQEEYINLLEQLNEYTKLAKLARKFIPGQGQKQAGERAKDQKYSAGLDRAALKHHPDDNKLSTSMKSSEKAEKRYARISRGEAPFKSSSNNMKEEFEQINEDNLDSIAKQHGMKYTKSTYGASMTHPKHGEISIDRYGEWHHYPAGSKSSKAKGDSSNKFSSLSKHLSSLKEESEQIDEGISETIIKHDDFVLEITDNPTFADFLNAAKSFVESDEDAVAVAEAFFEEQDDSIIIEAFTRADIDDKVAAHQKAGHTVSMPKFSMVGGKPHAEYVVTDKETKVRRKYIHHGTTRRVENMGTPGKKDKGEK